MGPKSSYYNNILSMGVTGVDNGKGGGWESIRGDHAVKLNGRTYHFLPKTGGTGGLQYFTWDAAAAMSCYRDEINRRTEHVVKRNLTNLFEELKQCNYLVQELQQIGLLAEDVDPSDNRDITELVVHMNTQTSAFDVVAITADTTTGERILTFQLKSEPKAQSISSTSSLLEPICYPLLFPSGEHGWGMEIKRHIDFPTYLLHILLQPERTAFGTILTSPTHDVNHMEVPVNRFQLLSRVGQHYLVDMTSRGIDFSLNWHEHNQDYIFGGVHADSEDDITADAANSPGPGSKSKQSYLSQSFHGSQRHLRSLSKNGLCLVDEYGGTTFFITATCNGTWPEIKEMLLPGQTAFDRPDVVDRVFKNKLDALLANIRLGKYFDEFYPNGDVKTRREVIYEIRVIEYQHRGMPHAHIVVKLSNSPDSNSEHSVSRDFVDSLLSATMPVITDESTPEDIAYQSLVEKYMVHSHSSAVNGCLDKNGRCTKGYHDTVQTDTTYFDERGFAIYKRPRSADLLVLPHNRKALEDWQGHIYIDYSASVYTVLYLYKYLFKGAKKVKMRLTNAEDIRDDDDINIYLRGRYLCSMDAMWRLLRYQTYPSPIPSVRIIKANLPQAVKFFMEDNKYTDMLIYFLRPHSLGHMRYTELFNQFSVSANLSNTCLTSKTKGVDYFEISCPFIDRVTYLVKRRAENRSITRMEMVYPNAGELFYLRLILLNRSVQNFEDARKCGSDEHATFQLSAIAHGYVDSEYEAKKCFWKHQYFLLQASFDFCLQQ